MTTTPPLAAVIDEIIRDVCELPGEYHLSDPDQLILSVSDLRVILEERLASTPPTVGGLEEERGTFACRICRKDTPHFHSDEQKFFHDFPTRPSWEETLGGPNGKKLPRFGKDGKILAVAPTTPAAGSDREEHEHIESVRLQEIADGAYGDGPSVRAAAKAAGSERSGK